MWFLCNLLKNCLSRWPWRSTLLEGHHILPGKWYIQTNGTRVNHGFWCEANASENFPFFMVCAGTKFHSLATVCKLLSSTYWIHKLDNNEEINRNNNVCLFRLSSLRVFSINFVVFCRLIIGYVFHPNGQMDCVKSCDLHLHTMGEDGNDPTNFAINFTAGNVLW